MSKTGSIILVEDDKDDQQLIAEILLAVGINNTVIAFDNGKDAFDHLLSSNDSPFIIICDINMPMMGGIELRKKITATERLRRKSIPFIFLTTTASPKAVQEAYEMSVQGFFEKSTQYTEFKRLVRLVYDYWQICRHPNN